MTSIDQYISLIQEKKQSQSFDDFLLDVVSRYPLVLYRNKGLISLYPDTERTCLVTPHEMFVESIDNLTTYGLIYDKNRTFFEQFAKLYHTVPFSALYNYSGAENSDYAFSVLNAKNCYLSFTVISDCEDIYYSFAVKEGCKHVYNSVQISDHSEQIYQSACVIHSYNIFYARFIKNSRDVWFSTNMIGCTDCLFCDSLTNESYCINNTQYSKEEYHKEKEILLAQGNMYMQRYEELLSRSGNNNGSTNISESSFVTNSEHVENGKRCQYLKNAKNVFVVGSPKENIHMFSAFEAGAHGNSHFYGVLNTGVNSEHIYNCEGIVTCYMIFYSRFLENCSYCVGCIGLKNKQYCILNKQYSKDDRFTKVSEIFTAMEQDGMLGDAFPHTINPFYFNDTIAHMVGNFSKEEVQARGFMRREKHVRVDIPEGVDVVHIKDLDTIIDATIIDKAIQDEQGNIYRIISPEYSFLEKHSLPLPKKHRLERMRIHFV